MNYFLKMRGTTSSPPIVSLSEIIWSWIGSFIGIAAVASIHFKLLQGTDLLMIIGSFGASAVLIYGAVRSPLAQPRNLIGDIKQGRNRNQAKTDQDRFPSRVSAKGGKAAAQKQHSQQCQHDDCPDALQKKIVDAHQIHKMILCFLS